MPTIIQLKDETKLNLEQQRLYPNESFDAVVQRLLLKIKSDDELTLETIAHMEEGMADIKAGRVFTSEQIKVKLGF